MIYKTIPIMERTDGSLQIDTNKVKLTQGDYNFNINYFTKEDYSDVSPVVNVQVSFRRKDGQQTGWLPLQYVRGNQYTINLKSSWFTNVPGNMYVTFRVFQTTSSNVNLIINTTSGTLIVNPTSAFNTPEPDIIPSEFEVYMSQTNEKFKDVDEELSDLRNDLSLSQLGKGIFDTEQELLNTYPNGIDYPEGTWVVLLSTNTVWLYNSTTKTWYNSNRDVTDIFDLDDNVYRFAKKLYEESANLFDGVYDLTGKYINPSTGQYATASGYKASSKLYPINTNKIYFKISTPSRNMVLLFYDANGNYLNEYVSLNNLTSYEYTIQGNAKYFRTYTAEENNANIMISATDLSYQPYNQNRHITNGEAEFLKEEYEKGKNKISLINLIPNVSGLTISKNENDIINFKGTPTQGYGTWVGRTPIDLEPGTYTFSRSTTLNFSVILQLINENGTTKNYYVEPNNRKTFTTTEKMVYYAIWSDGIPTGSPIDVSFGVQLEDGDTMTNHEKYNSSSHITNAQSDKLKELYNKTKNKFDISRMVFDPGYSNATINADGTITVGQRGNTTDNHLGDFADLEVGKTYILNFKTTGNENRIYFSKSQTYWYSGEKRTITQNDLDSNIMWYGIANETHTISKIMISEDGGEYQPYNGKIIYEKDITPVLVWENANPNTEYVPASDDERTSIVDVGDYKYFYIEFRPFYSNASQTTLINKYVIDRSDKAFNISASYTSASETYTVTRQIKLLNYYTINIGNCYKDQTISNHRCVPIRMYASNY